MSVTGHDLLALAETRLGQKYVLGAFAPKNNSKWQGPWDCAEFASWVVYQKIGKLYGCTNNYAAPVIADAYSGAWANDVKKGLLLKATQADANTTAGIILIRQPAVGKIGYVAISDGNGGTVEAANSKKGVCRGKIEGRVWHYFAKIPEVIYVENIGVVITPVPLPTILELTAPYTANDKVWEVQKALEAVGFSTGGIDGVFGPMTLAAVMAFQQANDLVVDGMVGPATAKKLGISW